MADPWPLGLLFLGLTLAVPGVAIFVTWTPSPRAGAVADTPDVRAAERLAVALAVPFALLVLACELLARTDLLSELAVWSYAVAASAVAVTLAIVRSDSVRAWWSARDLRATLRGLPATLIVLGSAAVQVGMVLVRMDSLQGPTPWYYWQTSAAIARAGGIPSNAHEWGTVFPFFDYHLGFNALGAGVATATGSVSSLFGAQLLRMVAIVGAVLGVWILARVWGAPRYAAAAAAVAFPCVAIFSVKIASYRPEAAGYMLLLLTPALLHRWFQRGGRLLLAATVISFVGAAQIHTPAATVALALCAATALVHFRPSIRWIGAALGIGLLLITSWYIADGVTGHRGPFAEGFADTPQLSKTGRDPTYEFLQLALGYSPPDANLGRNPPSLSGLLDNAFTGGFLAGGDGAYYAFVGAVIVIAISAAALRRWSVVRCFGILVLFVGLLLVYAAVGSTGWETYVPRRTGFTRLVQLWWVAPLAFIPLAATLVDRKWFRIATSAMLLTLAGVMWVGSVEPSKLLIDDQPPRLTLERIRALRLERDAIVLTNNFTQDFVQYNTPGIGLLDGRAPYLERSYLGRTNRIMRSASSYFHDPENHPFPFDRYNVRYVIVETQPWALGNIGTWGDDPAKLAALPGLKLIKKEPGFILYRVPSK